MNELDYPFDSEEILRKKKSIRKQLIDENKGKTFIKKKIAILGGSTTRNILQMLDLFLLNYGIEAEFYESEYNQYYQEAAFLNPELKAFAPDIIYIHTTFRNIEIWPMMTDTLDNVNSMLETVYSKFESMWQYVSENYHCPIIQNNFELPFYRILGNRDAWDYRGKTNFITRLNQKFYDYANSHESFFIHDIMFEQSCYGLDKWSNPYYWHMYKYACDVSAIPYMAYNLAHIIKSIYGKNKKVLALDLDNTLWGGVIGDDGADNIEIGQETSLGQTYAEFQEYVKSMKEVGVLLGVISKNDKDVAITGFERPDSVLKYDDFVAFTANWEPKNINLSQMADSLNLLSESFVFVDDNPAERHIVRETINGCAVPEIGEVENYILNIDRSGFFEVTAFSDDDIKRGEMYKENAKRNEAMAAFVDYEEYLKSLEMKAEILPFSATYMSRIAQLTNKSNQFNLTTKRYSQTEIENIAGDDSRITLYGKLEDKYGDNGVVSIVIGRVEGDNNDELHIELWLMSCRVLKRDMEFAMMDELVARCEARGISTIYGYYYPTAKNSMVKDFYGIQGFEKIKEDTDGNSVWKFSIDDYKNKQNVIEVIR